MKTRNIAQGARSLGLTLALATVNLAVWAQDGGSSTGGGGSSSSTSSTSTSTHSVSLTDGGSNWYNSPWVWVIGAAVFILLLVALLGGSRSRSRTTTTTTTDAGDRVTTVRRDDVDEV
ncbi:hypothetical protein [Flaviaesturariibacter aridisoli]|uniref:Uncharacterized protein n=1 Tax=Flaviaesturariibacter aridisoli TaxID=2545761 RepID=A0A4R4E1B3_9BACT|nr:hypothetical protein [Flaviaesturariibacter aridisoli]RYY59787.1 MAG: hypothetical protein EOO12_15860 [Chitinophagaceae bacterium]TCZ71390.1 hypothetical protein E0486_09930 [Flaviaesturariibacter aridisoli]